MDHTNHPLGPTTPPPTQKQCRYEFNGIPVSPESAIDRSDRPEMTPQLWSTAITSQRKKVQMTLVMLGPLTIYSPLTFLLFGHSEPRRSPFSEPFPPLESARRNHHNGHLVALFCATPFFAHFFFPIPIGTSVYAPLRPFSVFHTVDIVGFIFPH